MWAVSARTGTASAIAESEWWTLDGDCLRPRGGEDRGDRRVDIRLGGGVVADRDAHDGLAAPDGTAEPTRAVALYRGDHRAGAGVVVLLGSAGRDKPHQHLIQDDIVEHHDIRLGREQF